MEGWSQMVMCRCARVRGLLAHRIRGRSSAFTLNSRQSHRLFYLITVIMAESARAQRACRPLESH